jgi:hypothetical protein
LARWLNPAKAGWGGNMTALLANCFESGHGLLLTGLEGEVNFGFTYCVEIAGNFGGMNG